MYQLSNGLACNSRDHRLPLVEVPSELIKDPGGPARNRDRDQWDLKEKKKKRFQSGRA